MTTTYVPGTLESDPKKINMSLQQIGPRLDTANANITTNTAAIATLNAATYVNSINSRTGAITLNATSGITNSSNDIILSPGSASQFGAVKVDNTTITASSGVISVGQVNLSKFTASLGSDVNLNNTGSYFDGPSIAQGTSGTWFVSATITLIDTGTTAAFNVKLWDGTTVVASARTLNALANQSVTCSLSGYITSPAGNLKVSANDASSTNGKIQFNASGNSKDSTISAIRIA